MDRNDRKVLIVLKALLLGMEVACKDGPFRFSEDYQLCKKMTRLDTSTGETGEAWIKVNFGDLALAEFIKIAHNLTEEEIAGVVAGIVISGGTEPYREPMASKFAPQHNLKHILGEEER